MLFRFLVNILFCLTIFICGYYTVLYGKLIDNIEELRNTIENKCNIKQ